MAEGPKLKGLRISDEYRTHVAPTGLPVKRVVNGSGSTLFVFATGTGGEVNVRRIIRVIEGMSELLAKENVVP